MACHQTHNSQAWYNVMGTAMSTGHATWWWCMYFVDCQSHHTGQHFAAGLTCFGCFFWVMYQQHNAIWTSTCRCLVGTVKQCWPVRHQILCCRRSMPSCQPRENCRTYVAYLYAAILHTVPVVPASCVWCLSFLCRDLLSVTWAMSAKWKVNGLMMMTMMWI